MTRPKLAALVVAVAMLACCWLLVATGNAATACLIGCKYRHPVVRWEVQHHVRRCDWRCRARRDDGSSPRPHAGGSRRPKPVYPCVYRWTFGGAPYWNFHYEVGSSRNRVGFGPRNFRTCAPGQ